MTKRFIPFFIFLNLLFSCKKTEVDNTINTVQEIIDDMVLPHEGKPSGVPPSYDWALKPRVGMGNDPANFTAFIAWGQLYEAVEKNPASNTRVEIRNIKAYYLHKKDKKWYLLQQSTKVEGAFYTEDFVDNINKPSDARSESSGGISVTAGKGYNYHFWSPFRSTIVKENIGGIFTTVQARLILNDNSKPDDRASAKYLLGMGADYWAKLDSQWDYFKTNGDVGIGRFKYVRSEWRAFNMSTLSATELRNNPPPLE
jgi:hypothetical protein